MVNGEKEKGAKVCVVVGLTVHTYTAEELSSLSCVLLMQQGNLTSQQSRKRLSDPLRLVLGKDRLHRAGLAPLKSIKDGQPIRPRDMQAHDR